MKYTFVIAALLFSSTEAIKINMYEEPAAEAPPAPAAEAPAAPAEAAPAAPTEAAPAAPAEAASGNATTAAAPKKEGNATAKADPELDKKNAAKEKEATDGPKIPKTSSCTHPNNADCKPDSQSAADKPTPAQMRQKEVYKVFDHAAKSNPPPIKKRPEVQ